MIANCEPEELSCRRIPIKLEMIISMYPVSKASKAHIPKIKIEQILMHKVRAPTTKTSIKTESELPYTSK